MTFISFNSTLDRLRAGTTATPSSAFLKLVLSSGVVLIIISARSVFIANSISLCQRFFVVVVISLVRNSQKNSNLEWSALFGCIQKRRASKKEAGECVTSALMGRGCEFVADRCT
uniref:(northern house mosquito) hypothetical protein n=1 Tax=Culex pipiens TaxID=7175 RepID=A0A8D8L0D8_CULPI